MSVELQGHEEVVRRFERLEHPPESVAKSAAEVGVDQLESNYKGNPLGWRQLKPETVRRKHSSRILYESGTMSRSYAFRVKDSFDFEFYNKDKPGKVGYHNKTRPHLRLLERELQKMVSAYLKEMLK